MRLLWRAAGTCTGTDSNSLAGVSSYVPALLRRAAPVELARDFCIVAITPNLVGVGAALTSHRG